MFALFYISYTPPPSPVLVFSEVPRSHQILLPLNNTWTAVSALPPSDSRIHSQTRAAAVELGEAQQIPPVAFPPRASLWAIPPSPMPACFVFALSQRWSSI